MTTWLSTKNHIRFSQLSKVNQSNALIFFSFKGCINRAKRISASVD